MRRSMLLERSGAIANPVADPDEAVPAHYGDPLREQAALAEGRAIAALARDVVAVGGPDRLSWLTTLSSQILTGLVPDDGGAEALLLDAQGRIVHALAAVDDGEHLLLVTEAGCGGELIDFLRRMRFMLRVEVEATDLVALGAMGTGLAALEAAARAVPRALDGAGAPGRGNGAAGAVSGSGAPSRRSEVSGARGGPGASGAREAGVPGGAPAESGAREAGIPGRAPVVVRGECAYRGLWRDSWPGVVEGGTSYDVGLEDREHPGAGYDAGFVLVPVGAVCSVAEVFLAGAPQRSLAGSLAWEALRIEAGRPRWAREVDARAIPHELDWLRTAVHLDKGCYPGQETVARTLNLGRPPRRLVALQLDGLVGGTPLPGAGVRLGERVVGTLTSVTRHYELGPMGLALLRRNVPLDAVLTVDLADDPAESTGAGADAGRADFPPVAVGRVAAAQELLVSPEGRAQASPAQRPGVALRTSLLRQS
ncbi:CAF17-like 4Fe-4S cluster assembly/insertion protein YgfZ [Actinomyces oricola]